METLSSRQKEIIDAALGLIADKGIQALTIKNLSEVIGISEPGIYRHFANKWEILYGIIEYHDRDNKVFLDNILNSELNPLDKLESFYLRLFGLFTDHPALSITLLFNELFQNDKRLLNRVSEIMNRTQDYIIKIIEEGQRGHLLRQDISAQSLSTVLIGAVRLIITRWRLSNFDFDLEKEGTELWLGLKDLIRL
jgi:TetR/AcrR family fatty acid metabolism transcriptional regulator